jgi:hypothetical protein
MAKPTVDDWLRALREGRVLWGGDWVEVSPGVHVPRTPARLDGVFWGVSALTSQRVADAMGCRLITPLLADLIRDRAEIKLDFVADKSGGTPQMLEEEAMLRYSASLVHALGRRGLDLRGNALPLCCLGAKDWTLTTGLQNRRNPYSGKQLPKNWACNYGAYSPGASPSVSGRYEVIQSPGYAHNNVHEDYSQLLRLCLVTGGGQVPAHDGCTLTRLPDVERSSQQNSSEDAVLAGLGVLALSLL